MTNTGSKQPKNKPRRLRASSVSASLALHGILIAGAALIGAFAIQSEVPRRVFSVKFESNEIVSELPERIREELASTQGSAPDFDALELEPELLPQPVHPRPDPSALVEPKPFVVPSSPLLASSEMIYGFEPKVDPVEQAPELEPESALPKSPPEPVELERIEGVDPSYPKLSLRIREQGDVILRLVIDAQGQVTLVELQTTSGSRRLDQAAMSAAPTWRFKIPATGPPESFLHTVHFRLTKK